MYRITHDQSTASFETWAQTELGTKHLFFVRLRYPNQLSLFNTDIDRRKSENNNKKTCSSCVCVCVCPHFTPSHTIVIRISVFLLLLSIFRRQKLAFQLQSVSDICDDACACVRVDRRQMCVFVSLPVLTATHILTEITIWSAIIQFENWINPVHTRIVQLQCNDIGCALIDNVNGVTTSLMFIYAYHQPRKNNTNSTLHRENSGENNNRKPITMPLLKRTRECWWWRGMCDCVYCGRFYICLYVVVYYVYLLCTRTSLTLNRIYSHL